MPFSTFHRRRRYLAAAAAGVAGATALGMGIGQANPPAGPATATPIKHLVVIFQENVSFDHYFATYPQATNPKGEPSFAAAAGTPSVNGLNTTLRAPGNPNSVQPFRLDRTQAVTCDQDHTYTDEQKAFDSGLMDRFVETVGKGSCVKTLPDGSTKDFGYGQGAGQVMGYYDGNTVTGLWNYAQHYAMSDNSFGTTFGPSTPGALNLVSGQTANAYAVTPNAYNSTHSTQATAAARTTDPYAVPNQPSATGTGTVTNDPDPAFDRCSNPKYATAALTGKNIGDLLNQQKISWGWFEGGFGDCTATHTNVGQISSADYIPHHEPFQYYRSTANPDHTAPASVAEVGHDGAANHQYDLSYFQKAMDAGTMPAVSFLKAPAYQDGHASYSDPLDEQKFLVDTINSIQKSQYWKDTAVVVSYDDSDGWYDHQVGPIVNQSQDTARDALTDSKTCGTKAADVAGGYQDRCGYGPRLPLLVISPFAKTDFVDHSTTDQTSILRFVEDNWLGGTRIGDASFDAKAGSLENLFAFGHGEGAGSRTLLLDPATGQPARGDDHGRGGDH